MNGRGLASTTRRRGSSSQRDPLAPMTGAPYSYVDGNPLNQLHTVDGAAYCYSPADNLTGLPTGTTVGYDMANQATTVTRATGTSTLGYDTRGDRTSATRRSAWRPP